MSGDAGVQGVFAGGRPMSMGRDKYALAKLGYAAYGATTDFKNYQGLPMPTWDALPQGIKDAWFAASQAIAQDAMPASDPAVALGRLDAASFAAMAAHPAPVESEADVLRRAGVEVGTTMRVVDVTARRGAR